MKSSIKISETVLNRLSKAKDACFGKLYGTFFKNTFTVVGLQVDVEEGINLVHSFPAEVDFCGVFQVSGGIIDQNKIREYVHDIDVTDNPLFIFRKLGIQNGISTYIVTNEQIEKTNYITIGEQDIYSQFVHIRLKGEVPIQCETTSKSVEEEFEKIRKNLSSGTIIFTFPKTNVFLLGNECENNTIGINGDTNLSDICEESNGANEGISRKKKSQKFELEILEINMLKRLTKEGQDVAIREHAPLCILEKKPSKVIHTTAIIDSLAMIHRQAKIADLYEILLEGTIRHLKLFEKILLSHINVNKDDISNTSLLQTFHFYPSDCGHFLTRLYPKNETEDALKRQRQLLHKQLLLDVVSPVFRRANRYLFKSQSNSNGPLINPHEGVRPTDNGGQISLVRGKYEYYHYCQNKMDDNGWGCAYRSLQTLASWFKLQGYTDKDVPTFKDIQKCLVDLGDKPASFIGSKQWIGSTEVNFVLDSLLGVTSKILYVSSGEEMGSKGPELVNHFETQGSPIMIGGGVLAHTILGVDYNQVTGNVRFLILDPHYTGGEDLHVIQNKGWCGWKTVDFWEKSAYYNMCLPQVPREV